MKVALVCTGIGTASRGFEIFFQTLFRELSGRVDVTLYQGRGPSGPGVRTVRNLPRDARIWSLAPPTRKNFFRKYKLEQITFAPFFLPALLRERYDVVHLSEYHLGRILLALTKPHPGRPRFLFHNGHPFPPSMLEPFDHIQQLTLPRHEEGMRHGWGPRKASLLPIGIDPRPYARPDRAASRRGLGIPEGDFLVLSVGAVNRWHKRMDHTIRELAAVPGKPRLIVAGSFEEETPEIRREGERLLGERIRFLSVPHDEMPALYRAADLFVLASLYEGFGMAFTEAMAAGCPVVAHRDPTLAWLVGDGGVIMDMSEPGELGAAVGALMEQPGKLRALGERARQRIHDALSWEVLIPKYVETYRLLSERDRALERAR